MVDLSELSALLDARLEDARTVLDTWEDQYSAALFEALDRERLLAVATCFDHDLQGLLGTGGVVFAACTKCRGRFKVRVTEVA